MSETTGTRTKRPDYRSYLLRLWRVSEERPVWRASLEDTQTGERTGLASLEALLAFLRQQCMSAKEET